MPTAKRNFRGVSQEQRVVIQVVDGVSEMRGISHEGWFGDAAREENSWCFDWLPRMTGDHSHMTTVTDMADGKVKGYFS